MKKFLSILLSSVLLSAGLTVGNTATAGPSYTPTTAQTESVAPAAWTYRSTYIDFDKSFAEVKLIGCSASPCTTANRMPGTETDINIVATHTTITGWLAENDSSVGDSDPDLPDVQCTYTYSQIFPETNPDAPEIELKDLLDSCKLLD